MCFYIAGYARSASIKTPIRHELPRPTNRVQHKVGDTMTYALLYEVIGKYTQNLLGVMIEFVQGYGSSLRSSYVPWERALTSVPTWLTRWVHEKDITEAKGTNSSITNNRPL